MKKPSKSENAARHDQIKARVAALTTRPAAGWGMTTEKFWSIITDTKPEAGFDAQVQRLNDLLSALPVEEVQAFDRTFNEFKSKADDHEELREMAHELGGGAGDDGWMDFLCATRKHCAPLLPNQRLSISRSSNI